MSIATVLAPVFVLVALTFGLVLWLAVLRRSDIGSGRVNPSQVALREPNWPARTLQVNYCLNNQFELPVLFYVLTILVIITRHADFLFVILAWVFVLSRIVHAFIHTTHNRVMRRGLTYGVGLFVLLIMWIIFAAEILLGLP